MHYFKARQPLVGERFQNWRHACENRIDLIGRSVLSARKVEKCGSGVFFLYGYFDCPLFGRGGHEMAFAQKGNVTRSGVKEVLRKIGHDTSGGECGACGYDECILDGPCFTIIQALGKGKVEELKHTKSFKVVMEYRQPKIQTGGGLSLQDTPPDGNCWVYAATIGYHFATGESLEPQDLRNWMAGIVSRSRTGVCAGIVLPGHVVKVRRGVGAVSENGLACSLARKFGMSPFDVIEALLRVGSPGGCLWSFCIGMEFTLLASVLKGRIVCFGRKESERAGFKVDDCKKHSNFFFTELKSKGGLVAVHLKKKDFYVTSVSIPFFETEESARGYPVVAVVREATHFQVLKFEATQYDSIVKLVDDIDTIGKAHFY